MKYVSTYQASDHLRGVDPDDLELSAKIEQASAMVANYLGAAAPAGIPATDPDPRTQTADEYAPEAVPAVIQAATLLMLGYLYRYRDEDPGYELGYLPRPVVSILYPLRGPSYA